MKINESLKKKHNCIFKMKMVCVAMPIKAGDELTIYYGNKYEGGREVIDLTNDKPTKYALIDILRVFPHFKYP